MDYWQVYLIISSVPISRSKLDELLGAIEYGSTSTIRSLIREGINMSLRFDNGQTPIHMAAEKGSHAILKVLVDNGVDPNILDEEGLTALYIAAEKGFEDFVQYLIEKHADVNIADKNGRSPLYVALKGGHKKIAAMLIQNESNVNFELGKWKAVIFRCVVENVKEENRKNALITKLIRKDVYTDTSSRDAFREAIEKGDALSTEFMIKNCNKELRATLGLSLFLAASRGHAEIVKILIRNRVNPTVSGPNGTLPLIVAVKNGHQNVVAALVECNVNINMKDQSGRTALHVAIETGSKRMVECLINNSANFNMKDGQGNSPLMLAVKKGNDEIALVLIENRADFYLLQESWGSALFGCITRNASSNVINALQNKSVQIEQNWADPLRIAVENGDTRGADLLTKICSAVAVVPTVEPMSKERITSVEPISKERIPSAESIANGRLLLIATEKVHVNDAISLIENGADVNSKGVDDWTPLHKAAYHGPANVVRLLIEHGADISARYKYGYMALHNAASMGRADVVRVLLTHHADINAKAYDGFTPLHFAARNGRVEVARILIENEADINIKNGYGQTPREVAVFRGQTGVANILKEAEEKEAVCNPVCLNGGTCTGRNICSCPIGFKGLQCQDKMCMTNPSSQNAAASCTTDHCRVTCNAGYNFQDSSLAMEMSCKNGNWVPDSQSQNFSPDCKPVCNPTCLNGGTCTGPNICTCLTGFKGLQCQDQICMTNPSVHNAVASCTTDHCRVTCNANYNFKDGSLAMEMSCKNGIWISDSQSQNFSPVCQPKCDYVLTRAYNGRTGQHVASTRTLPDGFGAEGSWILKCDQFPNTVPLYECHFHKHSFLTRDTACEGQVPLGFVGFIYTTQVTGAIPLYRCYSLSFNDHMVSVNANCEHPAYRTESVLGYAFLH
ncbi:putative ankyrin repeat protein RF_0381 isoform X2 [Sitodiplosis mosellana]|uniref:putative ankyrin repeat protein RF_0381 isoform X2 n=1 Tax=Sitodiplosis mosellana TaxID=263140 RepID=UPI0024451E54|nr:putative ankyrin repeat protein RF_0381 isoform X2 [Sitodiplosis mosellana]